MRTGVLLAVISSLVLVAGCGTPGVHEADRGLEGTLRAQINEKHVDIDVDHGVVKLEGHVRTTADRDRIENLVRSTPGVVAVKDELEVTLPAPGTYGAYPSAVPAASIPVYQTVLPEPTSRVEVIVPPAVVLPDYPSIKVQAASTEDQTTAREVADQLQAANLAKTGYADVIVTVRNGNVSLQGRVDTPEQRSALLAAIQRATGVRAIYDQLRVG